MQCLVCGQSMTKLDTVVLWLAFTTHGGPTGLTTFYSFKYSSFKSSDVVVFVDKKAVVEFSSPTACSYYVPYVPAASWRKHAIFPGVMVLCLPWIRRRPQGMKEYQNWYTSDFRDCRCRTWEFLAALRSLHGWFGRRSICLGCSRRWLASGFNCGAGGTSETASCHRRKPWPNNTAPDAVFHQFHDVPWPAAGKLQGEVLSEYTCTKRTIDHCERINRLSADIKIPNARDPTNCNPRMIKIMWVYHITGTNRIGIMGKLTS